MSRLLYQLSYSAMPGTADPKIHCAAQSPNRESNPRPSPYHGDALPSELLGRGQQVTRSLGARAAVTQLRGCLAGTLGHRHRDDGRAVGADLGPDVTHLRGVEPHRDD